jgi:hypothetical protein
MDRPRFHIPARWIAEASDGIDVLLKRLEHGTPAGQRRQQREFKTHLKRWHAVKECRARRMTFEECWSVASAMLVGTDAAGGADAIRASYKLIERAGREGATLASYLAARRRDRGD